MVRGSAIDGWTYPMWGLEPQCLELNVAFSSLAAAANISRVCQWRRAHRFLRGGVR